MQRELRRLPGGAGEEPQREQRQRRRANSASDGRLMDIADAQLPSLREDDQDPNQEPEVADARHEKGFRRRSPR